jgi:hypothetical protein
MPVYRCYFFDPQNHITDVEPIDQPTDDLARVQAGERLAAIDCHAVELWDGSRSVCRLGCPAAVTT